MELFPKDPQQHASRIAEEVLLGDVGNSGSRVLICSIRENERPLKGIAGALDWRLRGFLSKFLQMGRIRGELGEIVYVPFRHQSTTRHLILVGTGKACSSGDGLNALRKAVDSARQMKFATIAVSKSSFPDLDPGALGKQFRNVTLEFSQ